MAENELRISAFNIQDLGDKKMSDEKDIDVIMKVRIT